MYITVAKAQWFILFTTFAGFFPFAAIGIFFNSNGIHGAKIFVSKVGVFFIRGWRVNMQMSIWKAFLPLAACQLLP